MKRFALVLCAGLGLAVSAGNARASWGSCSYSGYQPWYNIFAKRYKCLTPEEERLQKFWHDYYDALQHYYCALDHIDWVAYYKNHGYQINGGCGVGGACGPCGRVNYAPVFVSPTLQWAVPYGASGGPPAPNGPGCGPYCAPGAGGPVGPLGPLPTAGMQMPMQMPFQGAPVAPAGGPGGY
jgi:hypothetical protein